MKMKMQFVIFVLSFSSWNYVGSTDCVTPLGASSKCISLYDCPQLLAAFKLQPIPIGAKRFLKQSYCGFEGITPRVCCGPLGQIEESPTAMQEQRLMMQPNYFAIDPVYDEDSSPAPRNNCGINNSGDKIYGGELTKLDEFPWMAHLGYRKYSGIILYHCGGTLINHRYVLTAAHCITGAIDLEVGHLVTVRLGEYNTQTDVDCSEGQCADSPQEIPVLSAYPHPGYCGGNINRKDDIGLVRLARRVKYSYYVKPLCLANSNVQLDVGNEVHVAGWGKTLEGIESSIKRKLKLHIFNKIKCVDKYRKYKAILSDKQICAGGVKEQDSCKGDSGGPLMRKLSGGKWEAVGVISFGNDCGREGWPGIYTSIAAYYDWIRSTINCTNVEEKPKCKQY